MLRSFADGTLFGEVLGPGTPRVLALPGWMRTRSDFGAALRDLDALALDLPGFGGASPAPPEAMGSHGYAMAVAPVLYEMDERAVVVGHSFGGRVAVHLAAEHPDRIAALVLTGVPLFRSIGVSRPNASFRLARWLNRLGLFPDRRMEELRQKYGSADYRAATGVMRAVLVRVVNESYDEQLAAIECPVELVWGDDDTVAPVEAAELAGDVLKDATLKLVPRAGHLLPVTAPEALRDAVVRHL